MKERVEQPSASACGLSRWSRSRRSDVRWRWRPSRRPAARADGLRRSARGRAGLRLRWDYSKFRVACGEHWLRSYWWRRTLWLCFGLNQRGLGLELLANDLRTGNTSDSNGRLGWHQRCLSRPGEHLNIFVRSGLFLQCQNALWCLCFRNLHLIICVVLIRTSLVSWTYSSLKIFIFKCCFMKILVKTQICN